MFRQLFLISLVVVFFIGGCAEKNNKVGLYESIIKKDKLIVGVSFDSKPFAFKDSDGQIKGIEVDLAKEITKRMLGSEKKVVFKNVTPQDRMKLAISGDVDIVISTMTITSERNKVVNFSLPYFVAGQVICVRKDSKIETIDDLINKKVIVILGTTGEDNIRRLVPNALIRGYVDNSVALDAFKSSSGDAIITDDSLLQGLAMDNSNYMILPGRLTKEPYGIAFTKSNQSNSFKKNLNKIIEEIQYDGTLDMIKDKWGVY
jgi:aspartate/glutamate/glutamine transport system substrate-binding protein